MIKKTSEKEFLKQIKDLINYEIKNIDFSDKLNQDFILSSEWLLHLLKLKINTRLKALNKTNKKLNEEK